MSKLIEVRTEPEGVLTNVTSVVFRDPTATFGMKRTDTDAIVIAAGVPLVNTSVGIYRYQLTEPAPNLNYEYWVEITYLGNKYRQKQTLQTAIQASSLSFLSQFVSNGIEEVSCGDEELETFLTAHAPLVWALQTRRGVVLDLKYQYFVLDLTTLALDHVRMLIDTHLNNAQAEETGYFNASNFSDANMTSERSSNAASSQSSSSLTSFARNSLRTSSAAMNASAAQNSNSAMTGSDTSHQVQESDTTRVMETHTLRITAPFLHATRRQYRNSHMESHVGSFVDDDTTHYSLTVPFAGSITGAKGRRNVPPAGNQTSVTLVETQSAEGHSERRNSVTGDTLGADDVVSNGTGTRTNNVLRASSSSMSGSSTMTSSSSMASSSHSESHRESQSSFHSESASHGEMSSTAVTHSESLGTQSVVGSGGSDSQYYSQIFESLKMLYENTLSQIAVLSQQVLMVSRVKLRKMAVITPRAGLVASAASRANPILGPAGLRFIDGRVNR